MTKAEQQQLNWGDANGGRIVPTALHQEMQRSYLEYAMSVIVGRALPDVRDGLKPVHRRILYAMHELGLTADRPFRKCARVVGDVLGKYHPHGDQSVYDALVRLVQDFASRYPLIGGHGNFGSVDDDPPAAMRYTECRLAPIAQDALLTDIHEAIVDFGDNFDGSVREPLVLPARLPLLLLNGASGIAVGMATNIPPHNLGELVDGLLALIDRPDLPDEDLERLIPAPDFPTGGILLHDGGVVAAYRTGRGSLTLRGVVAVEELERGKGRRSRTALVVTELPYQVNKAGWIEKVAELVNQGKLEGIADIRDESDRQGMRVVIELRKDTVPEVLLEKLYRQTALQINYGMILLAVCPSAGGAIPRQVSLRQMLQEFLQFREATLTRQYRHQLAQVSQRLHITEGLVTALADIDTLIACLRQAATPAIARTALQEWANLSPAQADAILSLPLRRITTQERQNLLTEQTDLQRQQERFTKLLGDRRELLKSLKKDLRDLKKTYADARRTQVVSVNASPAVVEVLPAAPAEAHVQITRRGYVRRWEAPPKNQPSHPSDDLIWQSLTVTEARPLLLFTARGKVVPLPLNQIPQGRSAKGRGAPLPMLLPDTAEGLAWAWVLPPELPADTSLVVLSRQGFMKRIPAAELGDLTAKGLVVTKFKTEDDGLFWVGAAAEHQHLVIATSTGRLLRLAADLSQVPLLSRAAVGSIAIRLRQGERLVAAHVLDLDAAPQTELVLLTADGFAKRLPADLLRPTVRGSLGSQGIKFHSATDRLSALAVVTLPTEHLSLHILLQQEQAFRVIAVPITQIPRERLLDRGILVFAGDRERHPREQILDIQ
jgi:DNA gyrase subunit A